MLSRFYGLYRDELEADFQQFYGVNLEDIGGSLSVRHAAILAAHLPTDARCYAKVNPDYMWSTQTHIQAKMEHDLRILIWQQAHQGKKGKSDFPKPIDRPSKFMKIKDRLDHTDIAEIDRMLGIGGGRNGR